MELYAVGGARYKRALTDHTLSPGGKTVNRTVLGESRGAVPKTPGRAGVANSDIRNHRAVRREGCSGGGGEK